MELSPIILEQQYKALSDDDKKHYWRCSHCGAYILSTWSPKCLCEDA